MVGEKLNTELMGNQAKIPGELKQFLKQETYSLLIKGHTGTGKTTLALSILKELAVNRNCLYISTRISPDQIQQYFPWVEQFFDLSKKTEEKEVSEFDDNQSLFVDARLDESSTLFERITNELMDVRTPTIIIDTWDAIGFSMDREALMNNAKVLQTWRERARARLIFVIENIEDKTFDFLVDGIVELRQRQFNERRLREISISKLRGVRINKPSYIFSVNNSLFHSYDHYHPSDFVNSTYFPHSKPQITAEFKKNQSYISSGYPELDRLLGGGFPLQSSISVEYEPHVNSKIVLSFLSKIIVNFIAAQNAIVFQPFEKSGSELLYQYQKFFNSKKELIHVIGNLSKSTKSDRKKKSEQYLKLIEQKILGIKKKYRNKLLMCIMGHDMTSLSSKLEINSSDIEYLSEIKSKSDLSIFVSRKPLEKKHTHMGEASDIRLSILEIDGTIIFQSDTPWSNLYAIVPQREKGEGIRLEPIV